MRTYKTTQVFVPGGMPRYTYVDRGQRQLEQSLRAARDNLCKLVSVTGTTKSGKTVLTNRVFPRDQAIWVECGTISSEQELWSYVLDSLDAFPDPFQLTCERADGTLSSTAESELSVAVAKGECIFGGSLHPDKNHRSAVGRSLAPKASAISELRKAGLPLILDDFHYLPRDLQGKVIRAVKPLIFEGLPVILIAIPHRRYDAIRVEREMTGRIETIRIPSWEIDELLRIPEEGFRLLNAQFPEDGARHLASKSFGSPHLMQEFCRAWARTNGIQETQKSKTCLDLPSQEVFSKVAESMGKAIFDRLVRGPRSRAARKQRSLKGGGAADIYELVLRSLSHLRPGLDTVEYRDLAAAIRSIVKDKTPRTHEVMRVLDQLSRIASGDEASTPVLDWESEEQRLHIMDPFFAFYLSWGLEPPISDSIAHYLNRLAVETQSLAMLGMGRTFQVELPIEEAYVPLQATMTRSIQAKATWRFAEGRADHEEVVGLEDIFPKATILGLRSVILLGEPGAGKTTGARQLVWRLASGQSPATDLGLPAGMVPVFLRLRGLSRGLLEQKDGLRSFLEEQTRCDEASPGSEFPGTDLWNRGRLLWVLDGLDEVIDSKARSKVSGWISSALRKRPDDWFVVTCRSQGYYRRGVPLGPEFVEFHVRPLDKLQVKRFVQTWFAAAHRKLQGPGRRAETRAKADSSQLLDILAHPAYQAGHMRELCTNPLLLTILCIVFHEKRELPTGRAELYAHCVRVLLEYWRRGVYESDTGMKPYDAGAAQAVLAGVAWWLHEEQDRTAAPLDELATVAEEGLTQVSPSSGLGREGRAFLARMRDEAGILVMEGDGHCGFLHLCFQEYLAAEFAAREGKAKELASRALDSWWREVALLSLRHSRPFCEAFFTEMLRAGIAETHADFAERCMRESLHFVPGPFLHVLNRSKRSQRVAAVLRLLRDRAEQVPELERICQRLAKSEDTGLRGFSQEILIRRGVEAEAVVRGAGVQVLERFGITFVRIPPGEFVMGSDNGEDNERPAHRVRISKELLLAKYPVTNAQFRRFLEAGESAVVEPTYWDDRRFNQPEQPVVGVTWDDAQAFCKWAGGRLPTEAEWEYACRAGSTTKYCFGDDADKLGEYGWFDENSNHQTQPVGAKNPNAWGLHDMHGNVWEWCQDGYGSYINEEEIDPTGPSKATDRVIRGGCWWDNAGGCRAAVRRALGSRGRGVRLGFRLAADPSTPSHVGPLS